MSTANWIIRTHTSPRLRLFCFPYAGGGASIYRTWASKLPPAVEVCPIYLPGRENRIREKLFTHISPLVQALADALQPHLDRPFAFFGHSLGALVAFELTRHLRRNQLPTPEYLFAAAHRAPQYPQHGSAVHQLPDPEFIRAVRRLGGTPEAVLQHEELMQMLLPILRADFTIYETYVYDDKPPLACPISAFGGEQDHTVSVQELEGWHAQTLAAFSLRILPGNHFFLHSGQDLLLQSISQDLTPFLQGRLE